MPKITKYLPEIFDEVVAAKTIEEKVAILQQNTSHEMRAILLFGLHPRYSKAFKTIPQYEPDDAPIGYSMSNLHLMHTRLPYLFKEHVLYVASDRKRESIAQTMLQAVHFTEAVILEKVMMREFDLVTLEVAKQAFPDLFVER